MSPTTSPPKRSRVGVGARISWPAALAYYLALPWERRSWKAISDRFGVSEVRVGQVARRDGWVEKAEALDQRRERIVGQELERVYRIEARARAERLQRTLALYDRANDLALEMLPLDKAGQIDATKIPGGMPRLDQLLERMPGLFKMAELASGEATDRVEIAQVQPVLVAFARIAVLHAQVDDRGDVMRELEDASAGLLTLDRPAA